MIGALTVSPAGDRPVRSRAEMIDHLERAQDAALAAVAATQARIGRLRAAMGDARADDAELARLQAGMLAAQRNCRAMQAGVAERRLRIAALREAA